MSLLTRATSSYHHLRQVFADPGRKGLGQILREASDVARRTGASPEWYFINYAYRRGTGDYTQYLYRRQDEALQRKLLTMESAKTLYKRQLHERLQELGFSLTRRLAHNDGATFWVDGTERKVGDQAAFVALVEELLSRSATKSIFAKPVAGQNGNGCQRINAADGSIAELYAQTVTVRYLFEETLVQHPTLSAIYPDSVNTVRVLTCRELGEPPAAIAAVLRMGMRGRAVDNRGIFVGLDLVTGQLQPQAREFFKAGGNVYATHPATGFRFEGARVPHFDAIVSVAERAAACVPHELIGWDIAVTEAGPVIIEGNPSAHLPMMEIGLGQGMLAFPCFRRLCQRMLDKA